MNYRKNFPKIRENAVFDEYFNNQKNNCPELEYYE